MKMGAAMRGLDPMVILSIVALVSGGVTGWTVLKMDVATTTQKVEDFQASSRDRTSQLQASIDGMSAKIDKMYETIYSRNYSLLQGANGR